jgi:hypothetical protein
MSSIELCRSAGFSALVVATDLTLCVEELGNRPVKKSITAPTLPLEEVEDLGAVGESSSWYVTPSCSPSGVKILVSLYPASRSRSSNRSYV